MQTFKEFLIEDHSWVGIDLDGTLAHYTHLKKGEIGKPIPKMVNKVKRKLKEGKKVKIFTARASNPKEVKAIKKWLKENDLPELEVTNVKDQYMVELWDDRARRVEKNTGEFVEGDQEMFEENWKNWVAAGLVGASSLMGPQAQSQEQAKSSKVGTTITQQQTVINPIIEIGKEYVKKGFRVGSHPNFNRDSGYHPEGKQPVGKHVKNSYHYKNLALDISAKGKTVKEMQQIWKDLYEHKDELGIAELIYAYSGHYNAKRGLSKKVVGHIDHLHVAFKGDKITMTPSQETTPATPATSALTPKEIQTILQNTNSLEYLKERIQKQDAQRGYNFDTIQIIENAAKRNGITDPLQLKALFVLRVIEYGRYGCEFGQADYDLKSKAREFAPENARLNLTVPEEKDKWLQTWAEKSYDRQAGWAATSVKNHFKSVADAETLAKRYCQENCTVWLRNFLKIMQTA